MSRLHEGIESAEKQGTQHASPSLIPGAERNVFGVPTAWTPDPTKMIFWEHDRHPAVASEQLRTLRSRLINLREKAAFKTVLISSAIPGEGKSFLAANIAHTLAKVDQTKVALIDADLRRCQLHKLLGAPSEPGLSEYLAGRATEENVVQCGPIANLFFVPGGKPLPDASELLGNGRLPALLSFLSARCDWVLVDSSALLPVSDGLLVVDMCDAALLVLRSGETLVEDATRVAHELSRKRLLGTILNCVPEDVLGKSYRNYYKNYFDSTAKQNASTPKSWIVAD